ncbi:MAG TPA: stalk domain-containing protein, partial [Longimicrobiaceae bacterium]|nr:stalk domain-containing protein [Longimicrobiaceae bacterium]
MRTAPFLAAVLVLASSAGAHGQARWRLEIGRQAEEVAEVTARGYAALPASALTSVGAEVSYARDEVVARFAAGEARFRVGSAEVTVAGRTRTLANPVYSYGGLVYVPAEFFASHLAEAAQGSLTVDAAARLIRATPRAPVPAAAPPPARPAPPPPPPP